MNFSAANWKYENIKSMNKQAGNGASQRSAQGSKKETFFIYAKGHYCWNFISFTVSKIAEGIRIRLENYFFPNWKQQKHHLGQPKTSRKNKKLRKNCRIFSFKMSLGVTGRNFRISKIMEFLILGDFMESSDSIYVTLDKNQFTRKIDFKLVTWFLPHWRHSNY